MVEHKLKIQSEHYINVINGTKTAEIRYNDRNYQVDDILILNEIDSLGNFTGNKCSVIVTHVLDDNQYLQTGYVMLSFHICKIEEIMNKFWRGDRLELYYVPERIKAEGKRVWSPYRDENTIPIKIIRVYNIKEEHQSKYGKYAYKCKIMHDDVSTYDDITLTEREILEFRV